MAAEAAILVCPSLRREVDAVVAGPLAGLGLSGVTVRTVAGACELRDADRAALAEQVAGCVRASGSACLVGGPCMARLDLPEDVRGATLSVLRDTCFQLLVNGGIVERWIAGGAHLLTPGWLAGWRGRIAGWGLDRAGARQLFGEAAKRLLLLDTGVDPDAGAELEAFGDFLGLPVESVPVGIDHLAGILASAVIRGRELPGAGGVAPLQRRVADQAVVLDFTDRLGALRREADVAAHASELLLRLFAPQRVAYAPVVDGKRGPFRMHPEGEAAPEGLAAELDALAEEAAFTADGKGILLRVGRGPRPLAWLAATGLAFPRHRGHYLEIGRAMARAVALGVANARAFEQLEKAEAALRFERDELESRVAERTGQLAAALHRFARAAEEGRQTVEALEAQQRVYRTIVESTEDGVWLVDGAWRTTYANRRMEELLAVPAGGLLGRPITEFMDEAGRADAAARMDARRAGRREVHDFRFVRADGSAFRALVAANPVTDADGRFTGALALVTPLEAGPAGAARAAGAR